MKITAARDFQLGDAEIAASFDWLFAAPEPSFRCAVYRVYDDCDWPLYIGISDAPMRRFGQHHERSRWAKRASRITIQWFDNRTLAEAEEMRAINTEVPIYNEKHTLGAGVDGIAYGIRLIDRPGLEDGWYFDYVEAAGVYHWMRELFGDQVELFVSKGRSNAQNLKWHRLVCPLK